MQCSYNFLLVDDQGTFYNFQFLISSSSSSSSLFSRSIDRLMKLFSIFLVFSLRVSCGGNVCGGLTDIRPSLVNIGALFSFNSTIGRVAKPAIEAAVEAVNANPSILAGTRLNMVMKDTECDEIVGINEGLKLMQNEVVAILGPQSSGIARLVSQAVEEVHVPLVSFAATDPNLNSSQFSYFLQATHSDYSQMIVVADLVEYFAWRHVTIIYTDSGYGRSGMSALEDVLRSGRDSEIFHRAPLMPNAGGGAIDGLLFKLNSTESRVFIVHVNPDSGLAIFSAAKRLGMMENGYVWITTDWLSSVLDSSEPVEFSTMELIQGVLALRRHIPDSKAKRIFDSGWNASSGLNSYAYCAYDSVWVIAEAIDKFLNVDGKQLRFSAHGRFKSLKNLESLREFQGGSSLLQTMLLTNFTGLTGHVGFNSDRTLANSMFEVINIGETGSRIVGFWSKSFGLSLRSPETLGRKPPEEDPTSKKNHQLHSVVWPGERIKPKGWVYTSSGKSLRIGVPHRVGFRQFVAKDRYMDDDDGGSSDGVRGYCIDIFKEAISMLPYPPPYSFRLVGDGSRIPNYSEIVEMVANDTFDAAVGDITIVSNRMASVDFTQPYIDSGLVIIAPFEKRNPNAWAFFKPFTAQMWSVTGVLFLLVGVVIWFLEHRLNEEFRGPPKQQIMTIFWFTLSTIFQSQRQTTVSTLGRFVLIIWFFVVLILTSSYLASLTSILTVQHMSSQVEGLDSLINGSDPIGFHDGLNIEKYLLKELNVSSSRLIALETPEKFAEALELGPKDGGVAAIIDELPYARFFTSKYCKFKIVDQPFKKSGWGFAFQKQYSHLAMNLSTAILQLSENGDLHRIHDKWQLSRIGCSNDLESMTSNQQNLGNFWGLFLLSGIACCVALLIFFTKLFCQYRRYHNSKDLESPPPLSPPSSADPSKRGNIKNVMAFLDKKEVELMKSARKGKSSRREQNSGLRFDEVSSLNRTTYDKQLSTGTS